MQEQNYQKLRVLGEGTYGKCHLARDKTRNQLCVIKQIEMQGMNEEEIQEVLRQAHILQSLSHICIIKFHTEYTTKEGSLHIVMGYADGGDLGQKIKQKKYKNQVFPESQILDWFAQVCLAIQHVHERKIIHRDIKSQNIFLTKEGKVKLGDFGIAKPLQLTLQKRKSMIGTPYYMSPQICQNKEYSLKTDIWSLGVLLLQMCLLKQPFDAGSLPSLALKIIRGDHIPVPKLYSKELKKLVSDMMQIDPDKRPSIHEVLANPLVRDRAGMMRYSRDSTDSQNSYSSLDVSKNIGASRGLLIDVNSDDYYKFTESISPKSQINHSGKHHDMPVRRIDNYTREAKGDKKGQKKGDHLKRREVSEPNLTPKGHSKIDNNDKKIMVKNNSQLLFEKKKSFNPKNVDFKKKAKCSEDITRSLQEIQQIQLVKNDIYQLRGQISHRGDPDPHPADIEEVEELQPDDDDEVSICDESPIQTLEELLRVQTGEDDLSGFYEQCRANGGISPSLQGYAGMLTLAFGMRQYAL